LTEKTDARLDELQARQAQAQLGGGLSRIDQQHAKGKLTARERIAALLDPDTFQELQPFVLQHCEDTDAIHGDGAVTGFGQIDGRNVCVYAQDFTVYGGSVSLTHARKITQLQDLALRNGVPIIGLFDSGGARIQEGVTSLHGYGEIFCGNVMASGVVPQISVMMGPCAGGASYSPALTDFIIMVDKTSTMYITGPDVIKSVNGGTIVDHESLGGARVHASISGVAHFIAEDEAYALGLVRRLLSYLPANNVESPPRLPSDDAMAPANLARLNTLIPDDPNIPYDMHAVLDGVVDRGSFFEVHAAWARNALVGFARLAGQTVGIVAQQPLEKAGVIDIDASDKIARFVRFCDAFNLPLITFVDSPGFLPGAAQEHGGIIRHGAKIIYAYVASNVPKISVVIRKGYGGAYIVMSSKAIGADLHLAWPSAEIAVMGPEAAVNVLHRRELATEADSDARRGALVADYRETHATPYYAAERGILDNVIEPAQTRATLIAALHMLREQLRSKPPKKHGIMPV
jgi:acetyl-CoA carboxylase carboxyltransferase component